MDPVRWSMRGLLWYSAKYKVSNAKRYGSVQKLHIKVSHSASPTVCFESYCHNFYDIMYP
jgi:hypothetical protein